MILVGTVMSIASGVALPGHMLLFGRIINEFVYYEQAVTVFQNQSDLVNSPNCDFLVQNGTITLPGFGMTTAAEAANNSDLFFCPNTSVSTSILDRACDPENIFIDGINKFAYIYVGLATAVLIAVFIANMFWNISAYRQTRRMRVAFYRSILRQEIGWFDVNETAQLSTRLSE